jgi:hypothetical protein
MSQASRSKALFEYNDGHTETLDVVFTGVHWYPVKSEEPLLLAHRVTLANGTVIKVRHRPADDARAMEVSDG